jgi:hypothetical protein
MLLAFSYFISRYVSVNLWKIIIAGPKERFIAQDTKNAHKKLIPSPGRSPFAIAAVTPPEKIANVKVMAIPRKPHMIALKIQPLGAAHPAVIILIASSSPIVARIQNFTKPAQ